MNKRRTKTAGEPAAKISPRTGETWRQLDHTFHTSTTFMDYLHGDVDADEAELACCYEYARESKVLREAAAERDRLLRRGKWTCDKTVLALDEGTPTRWPCGYLGMEFLMCRSFPGKDWNELSHAEREAFTRFERRRIPPLPMTDVWSLKASGVFDAFKTMGEKAKPVIRNVRPGQTPEPMKTVLPVLQWTGSIYRVIFDVDFSKAKHQLLDEFTEWLEENRKLLKKFKKEKRGTTGKWLDRLKDLAAWRLYRELAKEHGITGEHGFPTALDAANSFADAHRKRLPSGAPKPFRDTKPQPGLRANEAFLLNDPEEPRARALACLSDLLPDEYPAEAVDAESARWERDLKKVLRGKKLLG